MLLADCRDAAAVPAWFQAGTASWLPRSVRAPSSPSSACPPVLGPGRIAGRAAAGRRDSAVYRLLQLNLRYDNPEPGKVLSLIGRLMPDVVTLNEVSPAWAEKLALLAGAYPLPDRLPHRQSRRRRGDPVAAAVCRRRRGQCLRRAARSRPRRSTSAGTPVEVGAMHLHWPWPFDQADQIDGSGAAARRSCGDAAILAGDLNATPWSAAVGAGRRSRRHDTVRPGAGRHGCYRRLPEFLRFAGLPIDQLFAKGDVDDPLRRARSRRSGPTICRCWWSFRCRAGRRASRPAIGNRVAHAGATRASVSSRPAFAATFRAAVERPADLTCSGRPALRRPAAAPS